MSKGINTATTELKKTIINSINESGLPAINVLYVLKDICVEVEQLYNNSLLEEANVQNNDQKGE